MSREGNQRQNAPSRLSLMFTRDAAPGRNPWEKSRAPENRFAAQLRKIAREVGRIVEGYPNPVDEGPGVEHLISDALRRYADILGPWASRQASIMIGEVNRQDERAWSQASKRMSAAMREEIASAPTGARMRELLGYQVGLIKSLPTEAAERVHRITTESIVNSERFGALAKEIARTGEVTTSRATLIARTETARTSSVLTQARAEYVGSSGYIWRTARDEAVRPSHRAMQGEYVAWNDPPTLDGLTGHAGCLPACRCYCEPVIPDV